MKERLVAVLSIFESVRSADLKLLMGSFRKLLGKRATLIRYFETMNASRLQSIRNGFVSWLRIDDFSKKKQAQQRLAIEFVRGL